MAGGFLTSSYAADNGSILKIKVEPSTLAFTAGGAANTAPTGAVTFGKFARVSGGRRRYGILARSVRFKFVTPPAGYKAGVIYKLPVLTATTYAVYANAATGTYEGQAVEIVGVTGEGGR